MAPQTDNADQSKPPEIIIPVDVTDLDSIGAAMQEHGARIVELEGQLKSQNGLFQRQIKMARDTATSIVSSAEETGKAIVNAVQASFNEYKQAVMGEIAKRDAQVRLLSGVAAKLKQREQIEGDAKKSAEGAADAQREINTAAVRLAGLANLANDQAWGILSVIVEAERVASEASGAILEPMAVVSDSYGIVVMAADNAEATTAYNEMEEARRVVAWKATNVRTELERVERLVKLEEERETRVASMRVVPVSAEEPPVGPPS